MEVEEDDDQADMISLLGRLVPPAAVPEATDLYELFLVNGAPAQLAQRKVVELFSPPRVTQHIAWLPNMSLVAGSTFDLRQDVHGRSWDFTKVSDRREARARISREKPYLVVGSPPCTSYSALNVRWNYPKMDKREVQRRKAEGKVFLDFAVEIYEMQLQAGRHFLHEHPATATSWNTENMKALLGRRGIGERFMQLRPSTDDDREQQQRQQ